MFTPNDLSYFNDKKISKEQVEKQISIFKTGFPYLPIISAASYEKGIQSYSKDEENEYVDLWERYLQEQHEVVKFVPSSGAASRMFKDLFGFLEAEYESPQSDFEKKFFSEIRNFAFYTSLNRACEDNYGKDISVLISEGSYKLIVKALLDPEGLNYGNLPKGLLIFHHYHEGDRTPIGEHVTEGSLYVKDNNGNVKIHFTVSPEHIEMFKILIAARKLNYEQKLDIILDVTFSIQKASTDTVAVDKNNNPFREEDGSILFRPGGHGALIENLNDINADVIFIKNVDNVVPDHLKENEARYKKLLAGVLIANQNRAYEYLDKLATDSITENELEEILKFTENELCINHDVIDLSSSNNLKEYLVSKLDRPFRVCGMVKNVGEPGGGPFIAKNPDGTASLQILESSQIDQNNSDAINAFRNGTHFNPVDLVCGVRDRLGEKYNLPYYVDANTGFISSKSKNGKELKALELPGLWNGAMSNWNTIFVEVPISTFNPVKTVNDLLRPEHQ